MSTFLGNNQLLAYNSTFYCLHIHPIIAFIQPIRQRATVCQVCCYSVFLSGWASASLDISSGQSGFVGSITIGGRLFKHWACAANSSISFCSTSLLLLNRYRRWSSFDMLSKRSRRQSGQDVWRKVTVMLYWWKLKLLPSNVMLEFRYWQLSLDLKTREKEVPLTKLMLAESLVLNFSAYSGVVILPATMDRAPSKWAGSSGSTGLTRSSQAGSADRLRDTKQSRATAHTANMAWDYVALYAVSPASINSQSDCGVKLETQTLL